MPELEGTSAAMSFELVPHTHHGPHPEPKEVVEEAFSNPVAEGNDDDDDDDDELPGPKSRMDSTDSVNSESRESPAPTYASTPHATGEELMFPGAPMEDGPKVVEPSGNQYEEHKEDIQQFREFLRSVLCHGAVGTAIGGCSTLVGEPQNLVIGKRLGWDFIEFLQKMAPITVLVWPAGIATCAVLEMIGKWGYGGKMPKHVRSVLTDFLEDEYGKIHSQEKAELLVQGLAAAMLVVGLCAHVTEVGFVGSVLGRRPASTLCTLEAKPDGTLPLGFCRLGIAIFVTTLNGECEEHEIAHAFLEAMPFVSLLVVFFGVVAIIEEQHIFTPIINAVLGLPNEYQPVALYLSNGTTPARHCSVRRRTSLTDSVCCWIVSGVLSMVSDNVFVATIFIESVAAAHVRARPRPSLHLGPASPLTALLFARRRRGIRTPRSAFRRVRPWTAARIWRTPRPA